MEIEDNVKENIIAAAQELFRKYGYYKTSVNEIAKKAKVAKATIYKYFESKEVLLHYILMDYIHDSVAEMISSEYNVNDMEDYLSKLIFKTCRITYIICNEFIGWDFIRESANSQGLLKLLSDDLEILLIKTFQETVPIKNNENLTGGVRFLIKASKSIVFSYAFTSVSDSDVRKNFVSFQKEILPYLVKAAIREPA